MEEDCRLASGLERRSDYLAVAHANLQRLYPWEAVV
jgi:hypothetical protein